MVRPYDRSALSVNPSTNRHFLSLPGLRTWIVEVMDVHASISKKKRLWPFSQYDGHVDTSAPSPCDMQVRLDSSAYRVCRMHGGM